jgi:4-diphosphocytidyl-2-C-methyl-D-erythritol kinase
MRVFPNAKINIGLNITEKRPDGYHNIETVFYPISLSDDLSVELMDKHLSTASQSDYRLLLTGMDTNEDNEKNLVIKAYRLLQKEFELDPIDVSLKKNIPFGAGLGGGSSDAAFMLSALNQLFDLKLSFDTLESLAAKLGADCPVFIKNKAVFAEGIGDVFTPVDLSLKGYFLMLVKPDIFIPTPEAYASVKPQKPLNSLLETIKRPVLDWKNFIINDFEISVFKQHPEIGTIKEQLYQQGALYASMSGSGSSVYGIFDHLPDVPKVFENYFTYVDSF